MLKSRKKLTLKNTHDFNVSSFLSVVIICICNLYGRKNSSKLWARWFCYLEVHVLHKEVQLEMEGLCVWMYLLTNWI